MGSPGFSRVGVGWRIRHLGIRLSGDLDCGPERDAHSREKLKRMLSIFLVTVLPASPCQRASMSITTKATPGTNRGVQGLLPPGGTTDRHKHACSVACTCAARRERVLWSLRREGLILRQTCFFHELTISTGIFVPGDSADAVL